MKFLKIASLGLFAVFSTVFFQFCSNSSEESAKDAAINILVSKEWVVSSVSVPSGTATTDDEWTNFTVSFTRDNMTTAGYPAGASAVWPSGPYTMSEDGRSITRSDDVVMVLNPLTETNFTSIFTVPQGTEIGARIAALEGDYTFNMK